MRYAVWQKQMNATSKCTFCGKDAFQVAKMITCGRASICNECVNVCNEILERESGNVVEMEGHTPVAGGFGTIPNQVDHFVRFEDIQVRNARPRSIWLIIGIVAFGGLMAWRDEMVLIWQRALISSAAAACLLLCVSRYRKTPQSWKSAQTVPRNPH